MSTWRSSSAAADASGPRAKCDQVVYEAIAKAAEIIVQSRCPLPATQSTPSSTRFNLHVVEIESVRSILQRWKLSLHVPLRLDVYYQHEDRRELLERWCLQYSPSSGISDFSAECPSPDPLVQLRHVCKKIVVWLRTLYSMSRLLPAHRLLRANQKMQFSMDIEAVWEDLPQFRHETLPSVPTPYGPLQWRVWYAPNVARLLGNRTKAQPIPMMSVQKHNHIAIPSQAQSAPAHAHDMTHYYHNQNQRQHDFAMTFTPKYENSRKLIGRSNSLYEPETTSQELSPPTTRPTYQRSNSLRPDNNDTSNNEDNTQEKRSGLSLALENSSAQRRTALHHPPPVVPQPETYGYAYNSIPAAATAAGMRTTPATPTTNVVAPLSSSPMGATPPLSSTPPLTAPGSHPYPPSTLIPPRTATSTPPFAALPTVLSEPQLQPDQAAVEELLPPITSLDLLHASPFKGGSVLSSFTESEALQHSLKHSSVLFHPPSDTHHHHHHDFTLDLDDMPFAVDDAPLEESAVASLAHKCATAHRLELFESHHSSGAGPSMNNNNNDAIVSSLADQLAEFRSFGASLHTLPGGGGGGGGGSANVNSGSAAGGTPNNPASGNDGSSSSTMISMRS